MSSPSCAVLTFLFHTHLKPTFNSNACLLAIFLFSTGSFTHGIRNRCPWILESCRKTGVVSFCRASLDVHGQPVVGELKGGEPSAEEWLFLRCSVDTEELFVHCRLQFRVCFVGVDSPPPPLSRFQLLHLSCVWLQLH